MLLGSSTVPSMGSCGMHVAAVDALTKTASVVNTFCDAVCELSHYHRGKRAGDGGLILLDRAEFSKFLNLLVP